MNMLCAQQRKRVRIDSNIFRWYRSSWGRYAQSDPIGTGRDTHLFRYAVSNPQLQIDRLGLRPVASGDLPGGGDATIVCDGMGNVIPFVGPDFFKTPLDRKCLGECTTMHEQAHANFATIRDPNVCKHQPRGSIVKFTDEDEDRRTERQAYRIEIRCLSGSRNQLGCECHAVIDQRIDDLTQLLLSDNVVQKY